MSLGLAVTKTEIDSRAGDLARRFQDAFIDVATMKEYLDATADADLVTLGYSSGEVATLKSAFADLAQLSTIWTGDATLGTAKDFTTFVRLLWGIGSF